MDLAGWESNPGFIFGARLKSQCKSEGQKSGGELKTVSCAADFLAQEASGEDDHGPRQRGA